jgi:hypothetical protein
VQAGEAARQGVGREWFEREKGTWVASHAVKGPNGRAYNRFSGSQAWADYLDRLRSGAAIVPINRVA